jgi:hypothetical protein
MTLTQQRGDGADTGLRWLINGIRFRERVISMTLVDQTGNVVFTFPPPEVSLPNLSEGHVNQSDGTDLSKLYDVLMSGKAKVVVVMADEFLAPGSGFTLTVPMQSVTENDWVRPYCP